ncbi:MAG: [FeFe] hydrogenase H-cluster radical SAM maturase HydG [Bacteroidales bacterium]|nr:[FeFe] hydrogenase H-cluster radical SAM maturase HydG [Bacteroidales bacterium]
MRYEPQQYKIKDEPMQPFIDADEIWDIITKNQNPSKEQVEKIIEHSLNKNRLSLEETAVLLNTTDPELIEKIKDGARTLKERIYGNRIVLFAPLYIGNYCTNDCAYCGYKVTNKEMKRKTLNHDELVNQVVALEKNGHKRLILVYGEHPAYNANYIAETVKTVYEVKEKNGEIRRVNINAAPLDIEGFKIVKDAGIGTYQVFQETYHPKTYDIVHRSGKKKDYNWRLTSLDRAQEAGIDDVGIGALFGLYNWKFEVMGLLRHVNHFEAVYNVGPHTISFPRIQNASSLDIDKSNIVSDEDFTKLVAILRLAVPYTGLILTAREPAHIRDEIMRFGVSQIDGGTNIEMSGYTNKNEKQDLDSEQFEICDTRTLSEVIEELVENNYIPSFCTACYRLGRTGEHFMEFSVPGFIKRYCTPNAILTLSEYAEDYANEDLKQKAYILIDKELEKLGDHAEVVRKKLKKIKEGKRDLYF